MKYKACPQKMKTICPDVKDCMVEVHQSGFLSLLPVLETPPRTFGLESPTVRLCSLVSAYSFSLAGSPEFKVKWLGYEADHSA